MYLELLKKAKENKIDIYSLMVAYTLECNLTDEIEEENFNKLCSFIETASLKTSAFSLDEICNSINRLIFNKDEEERIIIDELLKMNIWKFLEKCY